MNLALVLRAYTTRGGTEKYAVDLSGWLASRGHEVHVYCARVRPDLRDRPGIRFHRLPALDRGGLAGTLSLVAAASGVDLGAHDVVQGFGRTTRHHVFRAGGGAHEAWLRARDTRWLDRVVTAVDPGQWAQRLVDRRALRSARVVVCNSELGARDVRRFHDLPAGRVRVVRNGVDLERFSPDPATRERARRELGVPGEGRVALFLGTGWRRKGLDVAVRAFSVARSPGDRLVVAGRDAHPARWLVPARRLLGDALVVAGSTDRPEDLLRAADATLLPTLYDPAANSTLEAMACGVPPVTSSMDGSAEIVPDSRLVVADPRDVAGFASALRYAWEARPGPACCAEAERWPVSRNGEAMEAIYQELVHG